MRHCGFNLKQTAHFTCMPTVLCAISGANAGWEMCFTFSNAEAQKNLRR